MTALLEVTALLESLTALLDCLDFLQIFISRLGSLNVSYALSVSFQWSYTEPL